MSAWLDSAAKEAGHGAAGLLSPPLSPVLARLQEKPGTFAFSQAVAMTMSHLRAQGVPPEKLKDALRFRVNPALSFPPGDIASLHFETDSSGPHATLILNLMGLHGAASPLPAYFTEHVAQQQYDDNTLRDFFDIFHQRLVDMLYEIWRKYRYYIWFKTNASDMLSDRFFGFMGMGHASLRDAKNLRWPRLMAYMGLIAFNAESAGSLESILRHYFSHEDITIVPCIRRWVRVPQDQCTRLGKSACILGKDFLLGTEVPDQTGKFRIRVASLDWDNFNAFLPSGTRFAELQTLVKFVLRSRLDFDVELRLLPEEIREWRLEATNQCRLGWSVWAGQGGDGIVVLETHHQEL